MGLKLETTVLVLVSRATTALNCATTAGLRRIGVWL